MLLYNIESLAKKMAIDYNDVTEKIEHMGLRGGAREDVLKEVIRKLVPEKYRVGNGIIVDAYGTQSRQQDLFIFDAFNSPIFMKTESSSVIPVESVYATVEVKSTLSKQTLQQSINNLRSVKTLKHNELKNTTIVSSRHNKILGTIFAYSSDSSLETIAHNVNDLCSSIPKSEQPSFICVFDKGLIVNVLKTNVAQVEIAPSDRTMWALIKNDQVTNIYLFYLFLQQHLSMAQNLPPDLMKYAAISHKLDKLQVIIPKDMIADDMIMKCGGTNLNAGEIRFLEENHEFLFKLMTGIMTEEEFNSYGKSQEEIEEIVNKFASIIKRSFGKEPAVSVIRVPTAGNELTT